MIKAIFYFFSVILIFSAVKVISVKNPVHSALYLVLAFFSSAAIWLLLYAEFLAIVLILVYVGAVMVLFLFVIMMLDIHLVSLKEGFTRYLPVGFLVGFIIFLEMSFVVWFWTSNEQPNVVSSGNNTEILGNLLYTVYLYPFEIAAAVLLVAMVAAIMLTLRASRQTKYVNPDQQIHINAKDRIRLVNISSNENKG